MVSIGFIWCYAFHFWSIDESVAITLPDLPAPRAYGTLTPLPINPQSENASLQYAILIGGRGHGAIEGSVLSLAAAVRSLTKNYKSRISDLQAILYIASRWITSPWMENSPIQTRRRVTRPKVCQYWCLSSLVLSEAKIRTLCCCIQWKHLRLWWSDRYWSWWNTACRYCYRFICTIPFRCRIEYHFCSGGTSQKSIWVVVCDPYIYLPFQTIRPQLCCGTG